MDDLMITKTFSVSLRELGLLTELAQRLNRNKSDLVREGLKLLFEKYPQEREVVVAEHVRYCFKRIAVHRAHMHQRVGNCARCNVGARGGKVREFDLIFQTLARVQRTRAVGRVIARVVEQFQFARKFAARVRVEREIKTVFGELFARVGIGGRTEQFLPLRHRERNVICVARSVRRARALLVQQRECFHRVRVVGRETRGGFQFRDRLREKIIAARRGL